MEGFNALVCSSWLDFSLTVPTHLAPMQYFLWKLAKLHSVVRKWECETKRLENLALVTIEKEKEKMDANNGVDYFYSDRSSNIKDLFLKRHTILDHKAETLHQKSHVIWLQDGDENTK